jgi:putative zinc finger/helix-turn-helix YgiT family protein
MKCLNCNGEWFTKKRIRIPSDFRGEVIDAVVPAQVCNKCEQPLMNSAQMDVLRKAVSDTYRKKHGLLSSEEIVSFRKKLGMSQREFAKYLEVGDASVKRWETHYVQDKSQDRHIRLKCDKSYASVHAQKLDEKTLVADELSGKRTFSWEKFCAATLTLLDASDSPLTLNKALFYSDFLNYKRNGVSITGSRYAKLDHGPCPDSYRVLFQRMIQEGLVKQGKGHQILPMAKPDLSLFDDDEIQTLEAVKKLAAKKKWHLFDLSHTEDAFEKSDYYCLISYKFAAKLKIS